MPSACPSGSSAGCFPSVPNDPVSRETTRRGSVLRGLAAALLTGGLLAGSVLTGAAPAAAETVYITADRMLDVRTGGMVARPAVLVEDGRVAKVGTVTDLPAPQGATRIDLPGLTLLPGLIDMHVHLTSRHDLHGYRRLTRNATDLAIDGVVNARTTLEAGFTTVRNLGAGSFADVAVKRAVEEGRVPGPRLIVSGPPLSALGGHGDANLMPYDLQREGEGVATGPWALAEKVRYNRKFGADVIKIMATGGVLSKGTEVGAQQLTEEEMAAIVKEAHMLGMKVAAHAHGNAGIKAAIRAGVDTVEHASFLDAEAIALAKKNGTVLAMDIYNTEFILGEGEKAGILPESLAKERTVGQTQRTSFGEAVKAGVKLTFGSDAGVYPHGWNAKQFSRMVKFGMTPLQAIQAATVVAADALGMAEEVGSIAPGRYADMVAVAADPLADISTLEAIPVVIKGGEVVKDVR